MVVKIQISCLQTTIYGAFSLYATNLIFEFDETPLTKIEPSHSHKKTEGYEYCVITFFREVLDAMEKEGRIKVLKFLDCETMDVPIYEIEYKGKKEIQ